MDSFEERISRAVRLIGNAGRITAFTGAGISTESGISDFRSTGGIWARYRIVTYQEFIASHEARVEYWRMKHELFSELKDARPNRAHYALAELERMGRLTCLVTQNIDGLHQDGGSSRVIEIHGTNRKAVCLGCGNLWQAHLPRYTEYRRSPPGRGEQSRDRNPRDEQKGGMPGVREPVAD